MRFSNNKSEKLIRILSKEITFKIAEEGCVIDFWGVSFAQLGGVSRSVLLNKASSLNKIFFQKKLSHHSSLAYISVRKRIVNMSAGKPALRISVN